MVRVPKFDHAAQQVAFPGVSSGAEAWDQFWKAVLSTEGYSPQVRTGLSRQEVDMTLSLANRLEAFYSEPLNRIRYDLVDHRYRDHFVLIGQMGATCMLFGGNGISVLPYLGSHMGFQCTALDVSGIATEYCRRHPPEEEFFLRFFTLGLALPEPGLVAGQVVGTAATRESSQRSRLAAMRGMVAEAGRPDGRVVFGTEDLRRYAPGEGAFGAIVLQNVIEHFSEVDRTALVGSLYEWLRPGGVLVVESQSLTYDDPANRAGRVLEADFERAGFLFHLKDAIRWMQEQRRARWRRLAGSLPVIGQRQLDSFGRECADRLEADRAADLAQLRRGRKMAIFQYAR